MKPNTIVVQPTSLNHGLKREKIWLVVILVSYFLVTFAYGTVNPLPESPDEQLHDYTTQLIVDTSVCCLSLSMLIMMNGSARKLHSYHGRGQYPVNLWPTTAVVAGRSAIRLQEQIDAPTSWTETTNSPLVHIGDVIALYILELRSSQVKAGDMIELSFQWQVLGNPQKNLTTSILVGQADQPPLAVSDWPLVDVFLAGWLKTEE